MKLNNLITIGYLMNVKWIKITTDVFDDEKIRLIETLPDSDTVLVIWFKLLSMAGRCNDSGLIYLTRDIPYNDEMLSTILRRQVNTIRMALDQFVKMEMIAIVDDFIEIVNWEKHQNIEGLERIKEKTRLRVQKHRDKKKIECNVTDSYSNAIEENRIEKKRDKSFKRPKVEDIQAYIDDREIKSFTADNFFDFYESKGWMVGKNKMKDWKACIRTWQNKEKKESKSIYKDLA